MTKNQIKSTINYCKGRISALEFTLRPDARKYDKNRAEKNQKKLDHFNVILKCLEYCEKEIGEE